MRFLLLNHIQNAYQSLRSSRVRSFLTMLGVTIGIASITAILSLSSGASKIISDQIDSLGGNIAVIRPGKTIDPIASITQNNPNRDYAASTLTEADIAQVSSVANVQSIAPLMILNSTIKADSVAPNYSSIVATTSNLASISQFGLKEGQFLDINTAKDVAVVGSQLSINVFGTESSVGRIINIRNQTFTVIGVLKQQNNPINYNSVDFDNAVIINFADGKKLNNNISQIQQIDVKADSVANLNQAINNIKATLIKNHGGENDFSILTGNQISKPTSQVFYAIAGGSTAIAAISLIVGGIGIMNIMLVTVAERTREIGIRKALGASNADISWQFLIESLAISVCGGISGYVFGYILAFVISNFLTFDPAFSWQIAAIALSISIVMGTLFGLYPALRAARKDPIESLYQYN